MKGDNTVLKMIGTEIKKGFSYLTETQE